MQQHQFHSYIVKKPCNHGLHLVLTIITGFLWAPVWLVVAMIGRREEISGTSVGFQGPSPYTQQQPQQWAAP